MYLKMKTVTVVGGKKSGTLSTARKAGDPVDAGSQANTIAGYTIGADGTFYSKVVYDPGSDTRVHPASGVAGACSRWTSDIAPIGRLEPSRRTLGGAGQACSVRFPGTSIRAQLDAFDRHAGEHAFAHRVEADAARGHLQPGLRRRFPLGPKRRRTCRIRHSRPGGRFPSGRNGFCLTRHLSSGLSSCPSISPRARRAARAPGGARCRGRRPVQRPALQGAGVCSAPRRASGAPEG